MEHAPFTVPKPFSNINQASSFLQGYTEHGCKVSYEMNEGISSLQPDSTLPDEDESLEQKLGNSSLSRPQTLAAISAAILLILLYLLFGTGEKESGTEPLEQVTVEVSHVDKKISTIINIPDDKPLTPAVERLKRWIKKTKVRKVTRNKLSTIYTKRSDTFLRLVAKQAGAKYHPRRVEKFLRVALAFNPKNRRAWKKLIQHYKHQHAYSKAASAKREMKKRLGSEVETDKK